jgi:hypothetical protein
MKMISACIYLAVAITESLSVHPILLCRALWPFTLWLSYRRPTGSHTPGVAPYTSSCQSSRYTKRAHEWFLKATDFQDILGLLTYAWMDTDGRIHIYLRWSILAPGKLAVQIYQSSTALHWFHVDQFSATSLFASMSPGATSRKGNELPTIRSDA